MQPPQSPQQPPLGGGPVVPSRGTAQRWSAATRRVEDFYQGGGALPPGLGRPGMVWAAKCSVLGAIAVATAMDQPSAGNGQFCHLNSSTGRWVATAGSSITVYNPSPAGSINAGRVVTVNWVGGIWEVVMDPCT